jgi:cob(I)alamin adenosyltransferase
MGSTSLGDGSRVSKDSLRVETYGTIDEANSIIGIVRTHTKTSELITLDNFLGSIQNELFDLGAELSTPQKSDHNSLSIVEKQVDRIEQEIDQLNINLEPLRSFVLPGGTPASSYLHLARTVIRRAERLMVQLSLTENNSVSAIALKYVNRLSDLCFVAARYANQTGQGGQGDTLWRPGETNNDE